LGGNIDQVYSPPNLKSKSGQNNPEKRRGLKLKTLSKPKNWPDRYTYSPVSAGEDLSIDLLRLPLISSNPDDVKKIVPVIEETRVHHHLEIRQITSELSYKGPKPHPLAKCKIGGQPQCGVFVKKKILQGEFLGEFVGQVTLLTPQAAGQKIGASFNWIVNWKNRFFWCIDSRVIANEMMIVNDYRGLQASPNGGLKWIVHRGLYYFGYAAHQDIEPDEEITVDYGKGWMDATEKRASCKTRFAVQIR